VLGVHIVGEGATELIHVGQMAILAGFEVDAFVDNIFNFPLPHAKRVCEEIARRALDVEWSGYLNPRFVDEELVRKMAASGCKGVEFGTDSGAATMIVVCTKVRRRGSTPVEPSVTSTASSSLGLIFGAPAERRKPMRP
jgi:hypothetical protein